MHHSERPSSTMILFPLLLLLLPPDVDSFRTHLSQLMKLKCDSLPFRSNYVNERCYFSVIQDVGGRSASVSESNASALCSTILPGSKVAMGVELSNILQCVSETGNKCDHEATLKSGKCFLRGPTKMNFLQANKFCKSRGMQIPAPANELENRMVTESVNGGQAWIRKSGYSRWITCGGTENASRQNAGSQTSCNNGTANVIDQNGYWSNTGVENLMDVVCAIPAFNEFTNAVTKVEKEKIACNYHDDSMKSAQIFAANSTDHVSKTCYTSILTFEPYNIMGRATVETQRGCEVLCDIKEPCSGFLFKDAGFSSVCVLLSASETPDRSCSTKYEIFIKKTSGCVARTNLTAEFGVDPCTDKYIPVPNNTHPNSWCPRINQQISIIRVVTSGGRRISFSTWWIVKITPMDNMWKYKDYHGYTVKIVAAVCATIVKKGPTKCNCAPLPYQTTSKIGSNFVVTASVPVVTNRLNPCPQSSSAWDLSGKQHNISQFTMGRFVTPEATIACKAGTWFIIDETRDASFSITEVACIQYKML